MSSALEQIREANIARNDAFLAALGCQNIVDIRNKATDKKSKRDKDRQREFLSKLFRLQKPIKEAAATAASQCPRRNNECENVLQYLDAGSAIRQSLLLHGPASSGKSFVAESCTRLYNVPIVVSHCRNFRNAKSFYRSLWYEVLKSLTTFRVDVRADEASRSKSSKGAFKIQRMEDYRTPTGFADLCHNLKNILNDFEIQLEKYISDTLDAAEAKRALHGLRGSSKIHILLHHVDAVEAFEPGLMTRILMLPEYTCAAVKLVATSIQMPRSCALETTAFLPFKHYSDMDIVKILGYMASDKKRMICRCTGHVAWPNDDEKLEDDLLERFKKAIEFVLPKLLAVTRELKLLFQQILAIWTVAHQTVRRQETTANQMTGKRCRDTNNEYHSTHVPQVLPRMYQDISNDVIHMVAPYTIIKQYFDRKNDSLEGGLQEVGRNARGDSQLDAMKRRKFLAPANKPGWIRTAAASMHTESLQAPNWLQHLSLSGKYLLIAAYLASQNPKEKDQYTFQMDNRGGKRKRQRKASQRDKCGKDGNADGAENETENVKPEIHDCSKKAPRIFTAERLFGIFGQVVCMGGIDKLPGGVRAAAALGRHVGLGFTYASETTNTAASSSSSSNVQGSSSWGQKNSITMTVEEVSQNYGDAALFAIIRSLTEQRLLVAVKDFGDPSPHSLTLTSPSYQSAVTREMAEAVSRSVSFPLQDFVTQAGKV
jgi:hypothetical protein